MAALMIFFHSQVQSSRALCATSASKSMIRWKWPNKRMRNVGLRRRAAKCLSNVVAGCALPPSRACRLATSRCRTQPCSATARWDGHPGSVFQCHCTGAVGAGLGSIWRGAGARASVGRQFPSDDLGGPAQPCPSYGQLAAATAPARKPMGCSSLSTVLKVGLATPRSISCKVRGET